MKHIIAFVLLYSILTSCNSANNQHPSAKYEEKKASMAEIEHDSPLKFLKISGALRTNILNQSVIEGEIANKATLTGYTNIEVSVKFLDNEGAVIEKHKQLLDDVVKAGATNDFKIKMSHVKGANSVSLDITNAVAEK